MYETVPVPVSVPVPQTPEKKREAE